MMVDAQEEKQNLKSFSFGFAISQFFGGAAIVLTAVWMGSRSGFKWSQIPEERFSYHPLFMSVLIFMQGEAILAFRVLRHERKRFIKLFHGILHVSAAVFAFGALVAVFESKSTAEINQNWTTIINDFNVDLMPVTVTTFFCVPFSITLPNFTTLHSWVGISVLVMFCIQFFVAFTTFVYPRLSQPLRHNFIPKHQIIGLLLFSVAVVNALMGISQRSAWHNKCQDHQLYLANCVGLSILIYGLLVVYLVSNPRYRRRSLTEEQLEQQFGNE